MSFFRSTHPVVVGTTTTVTDRVYLFFIPDPERQSIACLSFREYEPFPQEGPPWKNEVMTKSAYVNLHETLHNDPGRF